MGDFTPKLPIFGALATVMILFVVFPSCMTSLLLRRLGKHNSLAFREDLKRSLLRRLGDLPFSMVLYISSRKNPAAVKESPRFRNTEKDLCLPFFTSHFKGYWLVKSRLLSKSQERRRFVLLWMHGGAFCFGNALQMAPTFLRVAEIFEEREIDLDIFSVEYTLAHEATFPRQINEAIAAYRYLLEDEHIDPACIIIGGDSAGGHLALSCLLGISKANHPKPNAALLLCPWVDLTNSGKSFETNKLLDSLDKSHLDESAAIALGKDGFQVFHELVDFSIDSSREWRWGDVLPRKTWVNVGSHDLFIDSISRFQQNATKEGADVQLDISEGKHHGWQAVTDTMASKSYYAMESTDRVADGLLPGSENVASGLYGILEI